MVCYVSYSSDSDSGTTSDASTETSEDFNSVSIISTSEDGASTDPGYFHHPQERDVRAVRQSLLHHLPLELTDIILDMAMYWPRVISRSTRTRVARASHQPRNDARFVYLVTPPIPPFSQMKNDTDDTDDMGMYDGDRPAKVHMVEFSLTSHDQGWGGDLGLLGPYEGSHTWFEARIYRFATDSLDSENSEQVNEETAVSMMWVAQDELQDVTQVKSVINGNQTWLIQRNVRASSEVRQHTITWADTDETGSSGDEDPDTGRGRGTGFIRSLSGGDRIALIVRALYPGWENHVFDAQVEVFYSI